MSSAGAARRRSKARARAPSPLSLGILGQPPPNLFPSRGEELLRLFTVVAIAASVAAACHYAATVLTRQPKPFCDDSGPDASQDSISDFCEPCPEHGQCSNGKLECSHGYKRHGRICIEDGEVNQTARKLCELVEHRACDEYARVLCDGTGKIWFQEADIMEVLNEHKSKKHIGLKEDYVKFAKLKAMENVERSLEMRATIEGNKEFKCPDSLAELHKPQQCRIRQWIYRHISLIVAVSAPLIGLLQFLWSIHRKRSLSARAEQLYEQVCEILEENALMMKSTSSGGEPWVVASWLRDHLLFPRERKDAVLWKKVEELILEDSRIDQYPKLIKGESKVVLEWQVEGSLGPKPRKKGAEKNRKPNALVELLSNPKDRNFRAAKPLQS